MGYKEKYEQALERAKIINPGTADYEVAVKIFPELKESEGEKIRKEIVEIFKSAQRDGICEPIKNEQFEKIFAWLEKQGEQKPADKVEPKFKVGDWITDSIDVDKIIGIDLEDEDYLFENDRKSDISLVESISHIWTILDAKDGDVLVNQNGEMPFIFKECKDNHIYCYCGYTNRKDVFFDRFVNGKGEELQWLNLYYEQVYPATKEQREKLEKAIHEAGYEWDAEEKELKKIEQNPAWSEEDEYVFSKVLDWMLIVNPTSSIFEKLPKEQFIERFKSLKERVQPKQEWSEEDEEEANYIADFIENLIKKEKLVSKKTIIMEDMVDWLKSLKERYTWEPSDEQMQFLWKYAEQNNYDGAVLTSLFHDLKKLREE